jgi:hypothetical protein
MSRRHPNNGPTFSRAPYQKPRPMTDEELAALQGRRVSELAQKMRDAAKEREFRHLLRTDPRAALGLPAHSPDHPSEPIKRRF